MEDRKLSATSTAAWACWAVGVALIAVDLFLLSDDLGHVGVTLAVAGALLHGRALLCQQSEMMRNAFELGKDAGREEALSLVPPQPIRR